MTPKNKAFWIAVVIALGLDQLTKTWIASSLVYADRVPVIDGFFYITHVRNPGMAFSLLADAPVLLRRLLFIGAGSLALLLVFSFLRQLASHERFPALALGLILGGASGNLFDRVFRGGEVVDWLHVRLWSGYSWPDFNVADSSIVIGVSLLVLELLASEGESRSSGDGIPVSTDGTDPRGTNAEQA